MNFTVDNPTAEESSFFEQDPWAVCHLGHEECSVRTGGPCWQYSCTCETTGQCMSCVPLVVG